MFFLSVSPVVLGFVKVLRKAKKHWSLCWIWLNQIKFPLIYNEPIFSFSARNEAAFKACISRAKWVLSCWEKRNNPSSWIFHERKFSIVKWVRQDWLVGLPYWEKKANFQRAHSSKYQRGILWNYIFKFFCVHTQSLLESLHSCAYICRVSHLVSQTTQISSHQFLSPLPPVLSFAHIFFHHHQKFKPCKHDSSTNE